MGPKGAQNSVGGSGRQRTDPGWHKPWGPWRRGRGGGIRKFTTSWSHTPWYPQGVRRIQFASQVRRACSWVALCAASGGFFKVGCKIDAKIVFESSQKFHAKTLRKSWIFIENGAQEAQIGSRTTSGGPKAPGRVPPSARAHNFGRQIRSQGTSGCDFGRILVSQGIPEMVKIRKKSQKRGFDKRIDLRSSFWEPLGVIFHVFFKKIDGIFW